MVIAFVGLYKVFHRLWHEPAFRALIFLEAMLFGVGITLLPLHRRLGLAGFSILLRRNISDSRLWRFRSGNPIWPSLYNILYYHRCSHVGCVYSACREDSIYYNARQYPAATS